MEHFLGLTTLIITDIDSVYPPPTPTVAEVLTVEKEPEQAGEVVVDSELVHEGAEPEALAAPKDDDQDDYDFDFEEEEDDEAGEGVVEKPLSGKCPSYIDACLTSNQTLIKWLPRLQLVSDLFAATEQDRTQFADESGKALVHVCYQSKQAITWEGETIECAGRTIEESFALENLAWVQNISRKKLRLRVITRTNNRTLPEVRERLFKRINISDFNKTDFALSLMTENIDDWNVPAYIDAGLKWLQSNVVKLPPTSLPSAEVIVEPETIPEV